MRFRLIGLALLAAVAHHLALPGGPSPWLGWLALLPLFLALERLRPSPRALGLYLALPYGLVFGLLTFRWMFTITPAADITVPGILLPGVLLWVLYLTLFPWLFLRALAALLGRLGRAAWLFAPWLWTGLEWLRGSGVIAFSWIHIAQTQTAPGGYLAPAGWIGGLGLGFLMVSLQAAVLMALAGGPRARRPALACAGIVILLLALGALPSHELAPADEALTVAAIQANIALADKWEAHFRMENLRRHVELSEQAVEAGARLLIWPETAFPVNLLYDRRDERSLREAVIALGADVLTGFQSLAPAGEGGYLYRNSAGLVRANGAIEGIYAKEHLLPFGESIPLADLLAPGLDIDLGQSNFSRGSGVRVFRGGDLPMAVFICYEMGFAGSVRRAAAQGARVLVNITNDGWFEHPLAMTLHSALSPMRAAENGLPVIRCGNSGITELLDASGRRTGRLPALEVGYLLGEIRPGRRPSFYARHGGWACPLLYLLYGACALVVARRSGTRRPA